MNSPEMTSRVPLSVALTVPEPVIVAACPVPIGTGEIRPPKTVCPCASARGAMATAVTTVITHRAIAAKRFMRNPLLEGAHITWELQGVAGCSSE